MTYATQQHMVDRYGEREIIQLTDNGPTQTGAIVADVLTRALEDADAEIDGYLAGRYTLPLSTTPRVILGIACDIARYRLFVEAVPEVVERRYKDAVKLLENIAKGVVNLGLDDTGAPAATPDNVVQFPTSTRVFGRDVDSIIGD